MTCYFRYKPMKDIFEKAGIEITTENRKEVDKIIHSIVNVEYKNCSATWKAVKTMLQDDEKSLITQLKTEYMKL